MSDDIEAAALSGHVNETWDRSIVPALCDYVRIPNKSPLFDAE